MKKKLLVAAAATVLLFALMPVRASTLNKICCGYYKASHTNHVIKIEQDNYSLCGDQIVLQLDEAEPVRYTVFSWTSFGNVHETYSLIDFDEQSFRAGNYILRNEAKLRGSPL